MTSDYETRDFWGSVKTTHKTDQHRDWKNISWTMNGRNEKLIPVEYNEEKELIRALERSGIKLIYGAGDYPVSICLLSEKQTSLTKYLSEKAKTIHRKIYFS